MRIRAANLLMILFLVALSSGSAFAQCDQTMKGLPPFHGLKLGMTVGEVAQYLNFKFPMEKKLSTPDLTGLGRKVDVGERIVTFKNIRHPGFQGVSRLQLRFFQNTLFDIELDYSEKFATWKNLSEFQDQISKKLDLPREAWEDLQVIVSIQCQGFVITANTIDDAPYGTLISITDQAAVKKIDKLAAAKLEQRQ